MTIGRGHFEQQHLKKSGWKSEKRAVSATQDPTVLYTIPLGSGILSGILSKDVNQIWIMERKRGGPRRPHPVRKPSIHRRSRACPAVPGLDVHDVDGT